MSCCFSKKCFFKRNREDAYKVEEGDKTSGDAESPKYSWDRRGKVDPSEFMVQEIHNSTVKKEGKDGGPLQIENCTDATIIFLHTTSQIIIDDCRHCNIILGPTQGSVFIRDSSNCTILTSCQQLRTRDCTSIRIGILCPTEPIVENSNDICFYPLAMKYPQLKDQLHSVGLRPFTNRVVSVHDFSPAGANGKGNFTVSSDPVSISEGQLSILNVHGIIVKPSADEFIPRFIGSADKDPIYLYIVGNSEPVNDLGDKAIELLHAVNKAEMKISATYDVETKSLVPGMAPFIGKAERMILFELSGNLEKLECDVEFDLISENEMEPLQKLLVHLNGKKGG
ncbi:CBN-RPI-2 protein [Caenorhabditis brenneri]|uniref:Protein XRP2 n=1 Tax=Caenorhabditis brenneri TaxID=135651 RepID=G0N6L0_CAEBE|nr:CBN-RPI-2 protein [Caenorhabditis brenneri]